MSSTPTDKIAARSTRGSVYVMGASVITTVSGFIRSVLLARLLPPEYFGIVTLALFFLSLSSQIQNVGLNQAFIQKDDDTPRNVGTYSTLRVGLTSITILITLIITPLIVRIYPEQPLLGPVLVALAFLEIIIAFNSVATAMFSKELHFKRLAGVDTVSSLSMTFITPLAVLAGFGIWALVLERYIGAIVRLAGLWVYKRPWRIHFAFDREHIRWYFNFGKHVYASANLGLLLDQFDDFWTGTFLGATALGYYSKAYEFARYPRRVLSGPLINVFFPSFVKLRGNRTSLSKAYFRACSFLVRIGFLIFGTFALIAPEFIVLVLGEKWLPSVRPLQLMLIYILIDPLYSISGNVLTAHGYPNLITRTKVVQLVLFVPAVILLGNSYGINGVAIAANIMIFTGVVIMFWRVKQFVNFSLRRMLLVPLLGLIVGLATALTIASQLEVNFLITMLIKCVAMTIPYLTILFLLERQDHIRNAKLIWHYMFR